jgi:hypothetical protein
MKTNKKKCNRRRLSIAADVCTIIGAAATVAGIIIGVSYVVQIKQTFNSYTTNQLLKRDTMTVVIRDTMYVEKPLSGDSARREPAKQAHGFEWYKMENDQNFEVFKMENDQNFEAFKTKNEQDFEKYK